MASMPHGRLGPPLWSFAADAHDCIMVLVRLDRPHTSSWRDAARPWAGSLRSLWLTPPGAPCRGPQTEPDEDKTSEEKRLTEKAPYKSVDQVQFRHTRLKRLSQSWFSRSGLLTVRHPSPVTFPRLDSLAVVTAPTPPQPELDKPHRAPAAPRRSGPSCWPAPPAPASGACGRACAPATSQPEHPCARPSGPPRWRQ